MTQGKTPAARGVAATVTRATSQRKTDTARVERLAAQATTAWTDYDREAGWPPRSKGRQDSRSLKPAPWAIPFGVEVQRQYVALAKKHLSGTNELVGRCELLGCHLVEGKRCAVRAHRVRVCYANYTRNCLVDVLLQDGQVERVVRRPSHCHPETPIEMAQAISIARNHPALQHEVDNLDAHAILQVPHPRSAHREHRCLLVVFTEANDVHRERRALFSAVVDLNLQQVISAGSAPCNTGA